MRYELKKLFSSVFMWICFGLVIAYMSIFIVLPCIAGDTRGDYKALLGYLNSLELSEKELIKYTDSEWNRLLRESNELGDECFTVEGEFSETIWGDFILYDRALSAAKHIYEDIPKNRTAIVMDSLRTITEEKAKADPDMGLIRMNELAVKKYNRVISCELKDVGEFDKVYYPFDNTSWDLVMIVFTVILVTRMFSLDISRGSFRMVYTSVNGRKKLFFKQLSACVIVVGGMILLHTAAQIFVGFFYGIDDFSLSLQMVEQYEFCPFGITLGGYYAIKTLGKLLFYFACIAITALITVLSRKALPSAAAAIVICLAPSLILNNLLNSIDSATADYGMTTARGTLETLRCFVPQSLLNPEEYFKDFDYAEMFGFPMSRIVCVFVVTGVVLIAGVAVSCCSYGKEMR